MRGRRASICLLLESMGGNGPHRSQGRVVRLRRQGFVVDWPIHMHVSRRGHPEPDSLSYPSSNN